MFELTEIAAQNLGGVLSLVQSDGRTEDSVWFICGTYDRTTVSSRVLEIGEIHFSILIESDFAGSYKSIKIDFDDTAQSFYASRHLWLSKKNDIALMVDIALV